MQVYYQNYHKSGHKESSSTTTTAATKGFTSNVTTHFTENAKYEYLKEFSWFTNLLQRLHGKALLLSFNKISNVFKWFLHKNERSELIENGKTNFQCYVVHILPRWGQYYKTFFYQYVWNEVLSLRRIYGCY